MTSTAPPRIRTDLTNPFARHTMAVRVPAIFDGVLERNPDYPAPVRAAISDLRDGLAQNAALPPIDPALPHVAEWQRELAARRGESWLSTDWFFAETYAYRQLVDRAGFWTARRDPFASYKLEEYGSPAHARAFDLSLGVSGSRAEQLHALLGAALWGNRIDLSFPASLSRGISAERDDLLIDDRSAALGLLLEGSGPVHVVADNAGTELTIDLVLSDFLLRELESEVILHVKVHPTFVSDATAEDVSRFLASDESGPRRACLSRLRRAIEAERLQVRAHSFWNGPLSLWELPDELGRALRDARLVVLKGDANYRRALNDAIWIPETPFTEATSYFPAPLLALRTLKSDCIVGLPPGRAEALTAQDPTWRANGRRGVASLGGTLPRIRSRGVGA